MWGWVFTHACVLLCCVFLAQSSLFVYLSLGAQCDSITQTEVWETSSLKHSRMMTGPQVSVCVCVCVCVRCVFVCVCVCRWKRNISIGDYEKIEKCPPFRKY